MAAPTTHRTTDELYEQLDPIAKWQTSTDRNADETNDWPLLRLCEAVTKPYQELDDIAGDGDLPGWAALLDPDLTPVWALPWLAQLVGVRLTVGASEAVQRAEVTTAAGWRRGRPASIVAAVQATLTGTKDVRIVERWTSAYTLLVLTIPSETPDEAVTLAAIISQKPAGIVLEYMTESTPIIDEFDEDVTIDSLNVARTIDALTLADAHP